MKNLDLPPCCTPSRKRTLILSPFANGASRWMVPSGFRSVIKRRLFLPTFLPTTVGVTEVTPRLELKPPPLACAAGVSRVVPSRLTNGPQGFETPDNRLEPRTLTSAVPGGARVAEISMTRNLSFVTVPPVLLVILRRISSVPRVELFGGSDVMSRTRFGGAEAATQGKTRVTPKPPFTIGLVIFSG